MCPMILIWYIVADITKESKVYLRKYLKMRTSEQIDKTPNKPKVNRTVECVEHTYPRNCKQAIITL